MSFKVSFREAICLTLHLTIYINNHIYSSLNCVHRPLKMLKLNKPSFKCKQLNVEKHLEFILLNKK